MNPDRPFDPEAPWPKQRNVVGEIERPSVPPPPGEEMAKKQVSPAQASERMDPKLRSPLGHYMIQNGVGIDSMARALGVAAGSVQKWSHGVHLPSLPCAFEIERVTKGCVPVESWVGMPMALEQVREMRGKQPDGIKDWPMPQSPIVGAQSQESLKTKTGQIANHADEYERDASPEEEP